MMHADKWYHRRYHLSTDRYPPDARPDAELLGDVMADGWTYSQWVPYPVQAVGLWRRNRETLWRLGALAERLKPSELS